MCLHKMAYDATVKEKYGHWVRFSGACGQETIVTVGDSVDTILRKFSEISKNEKSNEDLKRLIIETAAKLISSNLKDVVSDQGFYPSSDDLTIKQSLNFLPNSLQQMLNNLISQRASDAKVAMIGQCIMQCARPSTNLAPLCYGLEVQLHHVFRSRFLINHLNALGICCSYYEVLRFERDSAASRLSAPIGSVEINEMLLIAGDNVDSNTCTIDGTGAFHGLGLIAASYYEVFDLNVIRRRLAFLLQLALLTPMKWYFLRVTMLIPIRAQ